MASALRYALRQLLESPGFTLVAMHVDFLRENGGTSPDCQSK